jgi:hypothetical protein
VLVVRCGDLEVPYGYEYWGSGSWAGLVAGEQVEQVEQQLAACLAFWKVPLLYGTAGEMRGWRAPGAWLPGTTASHACMAW